MTSEEADNHIRLMSKAASDGMRAYLRENLTPGSADMVEVIALCLTAMEHAQDVLREAAKVAIKAAIK